MLVLIKIFTKLLKLLNSETAPSQLAAGFCFGAIVGLSPFFTWHNLVVFLVVCLLRVNFAMFFTSLGIFAALGFFMDPFFDWFGYALLVDFKAARPLWIYISTAPILPFFRFNNTVVLGSLMTALILYLPLFVVLVYAIKAYRSRWRERLQKTKFVKALKATKLYGFYEKYESVREKWSRLSS